MTKAGENAFCTGGGSIAVSGKAGKNKGNIN
jgi:hypothetical protein